MPDVGFIPELRGPRLGFSVAAFGSVELPLGGVSERLEFIAGSDFIHDEWVQIASKAEEVVGVPSVHIGPYMILFEFDGRRASIVGRARVPDGASVHSSALDHSDLLMRLDAISDSTRMRPPSDARGCDPIALG